MGMKDNPDPEQTFLFKLSRAQGLEHFQHIIFVSSPQDTYSPFDSSRVQVTGKESKGNETARKMVRNILGRVNADIRRVDVCMKFEKKSIDTFIGRAAHISLITDGSLLETISYRYSDFL